MYLGVSPPGVYNLIREGKIASRAVGKRRVISGADITRFLTGEEPQTHGDPIDPRLSEAGRIGGRAGGLAKARKTESAT
jgi:excisionase family DNA binding protein